MDNYNHVKMMLSKMKWYSMSDEITSDELLSKIKEKESSKAQATAMSYKNIEKEHKKYTRLPRTIKLKGKIGEPLLPRTAKIDNLKETKDSNEPIRLASKGDKVKSFGSDNGDEVFKPISVEPTAKGKNTRQGKGSDTSYEVTNKTKPLKRKTVARRSTKQNINRLKKYLKVKNGPEANDSNDSVLTQNMPSDEEKTNSSAQYYNTFLGGMSFEDYYKAETTKKQNTKALPTKPNQKVAKVKEIIKIQDSNSVFDKQLDKSRPTDGITAHCDDEELPPAIESIKETLQPRQLHILKPAMQNFFKKLTKSTYDSSRVSLESNKCAKRTSAIDNTSARYPVLSLKRLTPEDISKLMSRRTSDTDSPPASSKIISAKNISEKPISAKSSVENPPRLKTRTAEISKLVNTRSLVGVNTTSTSKLAKIVSPKSITTTAEIHKPVETIDKTDKNDSDTIKTKFSRIRMRIRTHREAKLIDSDTEQERPKKPKIMKKIKRNTKPAPSKTAAISDGNSSLDENVTTNVLSKSKESQIRKSKSNVSKADTITKRGTSKPETPEIRKRKCKSPILSVPKKKRVETALARSGPSSSSVNDGFEKKAPVIKDPTSTLKDMLENLIKKANKTTSSLGKKFLNLSLEALTQVEVMSEVLSEIVDLFQINQTEFEKVSAQHSKSNAMIENFNKTFKVQAIELSRQDCKDKLAVVRMLKDKVQAGFNHKDDKEN